MLTLVFCLIFPFLCKGSGESVDTRLLVVRSSSATKPSFHRVLLSSVHVDFAVANCDNHLVVDYNWNTADN